MKLFNTLGEFFALDIGTSAIRVVQLTGAEGSWALSKFGSVPIDIKVSTSDAAEDQKKLADAITTAIGQSGIRSRDVVIGIPSSRMFATVVDMPEMPLQELNTTIKYQADQYVPMSLDEAKLDWSVVGRSLKDPSKVEVLLASVPNTFAEQRLDLIEGLGFNVIALEPDPLALTRAIVPRGSQGGHVLIDFGDLAADVVMSYDGIPRLIRSIPTGFRSLTKAAAQNLSIDEQQATQFVMKFGLQRDKLEGQIARALDSSMETFTAEIIKSVKFFQTKYTNIPVAGVLVTGYAATIPGFADYIGEKTGIVPHIASAWQNVRVSPTDQAALQGVSPHFAVAVGLAQRTQA